MKLIIDGQVNVYYVQTLCMIFFPGEKFSEDCEILPNTPVMHLKVRSDEVGYSVDAQLTQGEAQASAHRYGFASVRAGLCRPSAMPRGQTHRP